LIPGKAMSTTLFKNRMTILSTFLCDMPSSYYWSN
jgi:hypothetical protein